MGAKKILSTNVSADRPVVSTLSDEQIHQNACPNLPQDIFISCSCHPLMAGFADFERRYPISATTRRAISSCVKSDSGLTIKTIDLFKASMIMCTEKTIDLDETQRDALIRFFEVYTDTMVLGNYIRQWDICADSALQRRSVGLAMTPSGDAPPSVPSTTPRPRSTQAIDETQTQPARRVP